MRPIVLILLVVVAVYVFFVKDLGIIHKPKHRPKKAQLLGILVGAALGFYDGFFGPGAGSFLIFLFVGVFGFDFLAASASAKVINLATNLASILYFGWTGHIIYGYAIPMALCSIVGAAIGARVAIAKGSRFVRVFEALAASGIEARPAVYDESFADAVREQLLSVDGVLVWVNPIEKGRDRSVLDAMLRQVADEGILVSAHPRVIEQMGTKEVLFRTRGMSWGCDTHLYATAEELRE